MLVGTQSMDFDCISESVGTCCSGRRVQPVQIVSASGKARLNP